MSKSTKTEDEYFAREEIEKRHRLAKEIEARRGAQEAEELKRAHWMRCPKCGGELHGIKFRGIVVDRCFHCHGTWLDEDELIKLAGKEETHKVVEAVVDAFRRPKG